MTAWLITALVSIGAVFGLMRVAQKQGRTKAKLEAAEEYQRTIKEMGRVEIVDSPDDAQRWLHERGQR